MKSMATMTARAGIGPANLLGDVAAASSGHGRKTRRRRISPQAGRAMEILGHAIEYLVDEYAHQSSRRSTGRAKPEPAIRAQLEGNLEAAYLLMRINSQIYLACPEAPTMWERCRSLLRFRAA
jgi:hypothetical protein